MAEGFDYEFDTDINRIDFEKVGKWLASSYWSPGISLDKVRRAAEHSSLVIGCYSASGEQVGYMRVISDRTTFAWLCDVYVDPDFRGKEIGTRMVEFAKRHPEHQGLRKWLLGTVDAHGVYAKIGFTAPPHPERLMIYVPADAPKTC